MNTSAAFYAAACIVIIMLAIVFAKPLKSLFGIILNSALGCGFIALFNFAGGLFGAYLGVNAFTAVTVGILGVPGFISLLVLKYLLK